MNFETLSGVYQHARTVSRLLGDGSRIEDAMKRVLDNQHLRRDLIDALSCLESHIRVMGMDEVVTLTKEK